LATFSGEIFMLKRLVLLILLLAGISGWPLLAEEAGKANTDTSGKSGQPPTDADSGKSGDKSTKKPGKPEDEEPECD
jgi:hypothetical protein